MPPFLSSHGLKGLRDGSRWQRVRVTDTGYWAAEEPFCYRQAARRGSTTLPGHGTGKNNFPSAPAPVCESGCCCGRQLNLCFSHSSPQHT